MTDMNQELREAIAAADDALHHLETARTCLQSAKWWGISDILGGGFLSTLLKHNKVQKAQNELAAARAALISFSNELRDVRDAVRADIRVDDFLGFADYFFDGIIADWMMQSRIQSARRQVEEAIARVNAIRRALAGQLGI